MYQVLTLYSC